MDPLKLAALNPNRERRQPLKNKYNHWIYDGEWIIGTDIREGKGTLYLFDDEDIYQGYFNNNKYSITGRFLWLDGDVYEGEYRDGERHGQGTFKKVDGY